MNVREEHERPQNVSQRQDRTLLAKQVASNQCHPYNGGSNA
jgi:hypothetical protein